MGKVASVESQSDENGLPTWKLAAARVTDSGAASSALRCAGSVAILRNCTRFTSIIMKPTHSVAHWMVLLYTIRFGNTLHIGRPARCTPINTSRRRMKVAYSSLPFCNSNAVEMRWRLSWSQSLPQYCSTLHISSANSFCPTTITVWNMFKFITEISYTSQGIVQAQQKLNRPPLWYPICTIFGLL